jgi:predicted thioesterase
MNHDISVGLTHTLKTAVTHDLTASVIGSGHLDVYATPQMIAKMEQAAEACVIDGLLPGFGTVGTLVSVSHVAATPVGMTVTTTATLREIDGRRLIFDVEAHDGAELIGRGTHERFIIQRDRFMEKVNMKTKREQL